MKQKHLYLMCGAAGSGKSTYIESHFKPNEDYVISRDAIRFSLIKDGDEYFSQEDKVFDTFIQYIQEAIDDENIPKNIYCDATHLTEASRKKVLNKLNLENVENITVIVLRPDLKEVLARNERRKGLYRKYVPRSVVKKMYFSFERPEYDKNRNFDVLYVEVPESWKKFG